METSEARRYASRALGRLEPLRASWASLGPLWSNVEGAISELMELEWELELEELEGAGILTVTPVEIGPRLRDLGPLQPADPEGP